MNLKTLRWVGYSFQRPGMHRIHHQRSLHDYNYSNLLIWDILFGIFRNPNIFNHKTGFHPEKEKKFKEMFIFKNVHKT